ncbi:MAG: RNA polymerase sigma factor [Planctomycetota bacterium]
MHTTTHLAARAMEGGLPAARVAHAALFERICARIQRYFLRMLRDPDAAADCLQRTLVLLEQSLRSGAYEPDRSFNTWMWLKARTVFAQHCRERERRPDPLEHEPPAPGDPARGVEERLDADTVLAEVRRRLGEEAYEAFVLYYEGGLTQAEVAAALERDRKTVRQRIQEAHTLIDSLLGRA